MTLPSASMRLLISGCHLRRAHQAIRTTKCEAQEPSYSRKKVICSTKCNSPSNANQSTLCLTNKRLPRRKLKKRLSQLIRNLKSKSSKRSRKDRSKFDPCSWPKVTRIWLSPMLKLKSWLTTSPRKFPRSNLNLNQQTSRICLK